MHTALKNYATRCTCILAFTAAAIMPAHGGITVVGDVPAGALAENPETGLDDGSTRLAPPGSGVSWYVKGQTFGLAAPATVTTITVRVDENLGSTDISGSLTLELFPVSGGVPSGPTLATQTDALTPVSAGDYLAITLDSPPALGAGAYALVLSTSDLDMNFDVQNTGSSFGGGTLVRSDGASWQIRADNDFIFAVSGIPSNLVLGHPASWPATFLENPPPAGSDPFVLDEGSDLGQTFQLGQDAVVSNVMFQLDDDTTPVDPVGSLTLQILETDSRGRPTGSPLLELTGDLPGGVTAGSILSFDLPAPITLPAGGYATLLRSTNVTLAFNASSGDLFAGGSLISDTGAGWVRPDPGLDMVFGLVGELDKPPEPGTGPNIIVILADDLGWTDISTGRPNLGNPSDMYETPNLERLAAEGLSFTACYVQPNCAPTRAALLSGKYAPRTGNGVYNVNGLNRGSGTPVLVGPSQNEDVPASTHTMAEMLKDAGYVTVHIGKYHVGGHEGGSATLPLGQGFDFNYGGTSVGNPGGYFANSSGIFVSGNVGPELDAYGQPYDANYINDILVPIQNGNNASTLDGTNKHLADAEADAAIDFMKSHRAGPDAAYPFYIQFHSYAVHTPIQPRPDLSSKYVGREGLVHDSTGYAGLVEGLDQSVGRILNYLDDPNEDGDPSDSIADRTLVIFFSDNGGHEGPTDNAPLRSRKGSLYEGGTRVPMIVRMPGTVPSNQVTHTMVHAVDFFPSLMEVAGGATSQSLDGMSFAAHLTDPGGQPRDRGAIFYHFPGYLDNRARPCSVVIKEIGGKRYKLIYNYDPSYDPNTGDDGIKVEPGDWELYNITDDLGETTNLLNLDYWNWITHEAIAQELASGLNAWLTKSEGDWAPSYPSVRATGEVLGPAPANVDPVEPAPGQAFRMLEAAPNTLSDKVDLAWVSQSGFTFGVEASSDLASWSNLVSGIPGQSGSLSTNLADPGRASEGLRFYRARVAP